MAIRSESHEEAALADHVQKRLSEVGGLAIERVGDNVVACTNLGRDQRLVVAGHLDTVPANDNAEPKIDGDVLWGLGSADMKGGLAVMLELATAGPSPPSTSPGSSTRPKRWRPRTTAWVTCSSSVPISWPETPPSSASPPTPLWRSDARAPCGCR